MDYSTVTLRPTKILFVCTGNICRSPTAEGLLRDALMKQKKYADFLVDSAAIDSHHIGHPPDARSQATARKRGVDISDLRARNVRTSDFNQFDLILAMDETHLTRLHAAAPIGTTADIALYLPYCGVRDIQEVPDPYYGSKKDFELVFDLCAEATGRLAKKLL